MSLVAQLDRRVARLRRRDLGHELIDRDRVSLRLTNLAAGQPDRAAIVMMSETVRMMESADRRDLSAMFFERRERLGKLIVGAGLGDLEVDRVHAILEVDEHAPF